jgi:hypothetical protein
MDADVVSSLKRMQLAGPDMLIDGYDQYANHDNEVVNISPDDASEEPSETLPRADDCMLFSISILPPTSPLTCS